MLKSLSAVAFMAVATKAGTAPGALPAFYSNGVWTGTYQSNADADKDVSNLWVLDPSYSDDFEKTSTWKAPYRKWGYEYYDMEDCSGGAESYYRKNSFDPTKITCKPTWYGAQPAVISKNNIVPQSSSSDGKVEIWVKPATSDDDALIAAANADIANDNDCGCDYKDYTSGMLRSIRTFREGYSEALMTRPTNACYQASIWFQSENVEVSLALAGDELTLTAYVFTHNETVSSGTATLTHRASNDGQAHKYGIQWEQSGDLSVHIDGAATTLKVSGQTWNPTRKYQNDNKDDSVNSQQLNLMIDLTIAEDCDLATETLTGDKLVVDYFAQYEFDCAQALSVSMSSDGPGAGSGSLPGWVGDSTACMATGFKSMCTTHGARGLCDNNFPGAAKVSHAPWESACSLYSSSTSMSADYAERLCGGYLDSTGSGWDPVADENTKIDAYTGSESVMYKERNKGSLGHCWWDPTAKNANSDASYVGKCVARAPGHLELDWSNEPNKCGGTPNKPQLDKTEGYGMWCYNMCVRKTAVNFNRQGSWKYMCQGAVNHQGKEFCSQTSAKQGTVKLNKAGSKYVIATTYASCAASTLIDLPPGEKDTVPYKRGMHCYHKPYEGSNNKAPIAVNGKLYKGSYCKPRMMTEGSYDKGGIPAWRYTAGGKADCEESADRTWVCTKLGSGKFKSVCRVAKFNDNPKNDLSIKASVLDGDYCLSQAQCGTDNTAFQWDGTSCKPN